MTRGKLFMMTGQRISAERAEAWGLVTMAVPNDKLDEAVRALAGGWPIARRSRSGREDGAQPRRRGTPQTALELERKAYAWLRSTHDYARA